MTAPETSSISPFFVVRDVGRSVGFYCHYLGFDVRFQEPADGPFFAIIGRGGVQIFLKSQDGVAPQPNSTRHRELRWDAFVFVPDPDALAADFAARDAAFSVSLQNTHDGLLGFEIADPDGYVLFFGRPA
ncbi:MAG: VOC family protein [Proteobacteria bacterium]|nr:VOC family protein [Pseudomonadota bacterium]